VCRVGQSRTYTPYMTVLKMPKIPLYGNTPYIYGFGQPYACMTGSTSGQQFTARLHLYTVVLLYICIVHLYSTLFTARALLYTVHCACTSVHFSLRIYTVVRPVHCSMSRIGPNRIYTPNICMSTQGNL